MLTVSSFEVHLRRLPPSFDGFRIVHLSDLHGVYFGKQNSDLLRTILAQSPDVVAATGDMLDRRRGHGTGFVDLARLLTPHVPVYSIRGNHEQCMAVSAAERLALTQYEQELQQAGVHLLRDSTAVIPRDGAEILLCGLTLPVFCYKPHAARAPHACLPPEMVAKYIGVVDENRCSILLAHSPLFFSSYATWGADLVLSGHVHGGLIRLPGIGGLLSPYHRFFPKYDAGLYWRQDTPMVVSRGLGDSPFRLRINNPPEVVVVTLRGDGSHFSAD